MNQVSQHTERFKGLLGEISEEVESLKQEIRELKKENAKLVAKLNDMRGKQSDIFSAITESERLAMRQQVQSMIAKIDNHINAQS